MRGCFNSWFCSMVCASLFGWSVRGACLLVRRFGWYVGIWVVSFGSCLR